MIGKRSSQRDLFDVGNVFPVELDPKSFHGQLARAAPRLFPDADFASFYKDGGRPSVPPSQLALLTLLQHEAGCSDEEAALRSGYDLRWAAVLGRPAGTALCAKSTLQLFRSHLIIHNGVRKVFQQSIKEARRAGLLKGTVIRAAIDTKPIFGRGAVQDTYNLLGTGIRQLATALAAQAGQTAELWAREHDLGRYLPNRHASLKGSTQIDWSEPLQKNQFLTEIVTDAWRLWRLAHELLHELSEPEAARIREAKELLGQLLLQDVDCRTGPDGTRETTIKEGVTPGRIPSATDTEQRHGRKSKSKRFNGHKASVLVDKESAIIVGGEVLAGDAPDATEVVEQVERAEENAGLPVEETNGDCAYGSGETRQAFADAGRVLHAKVPQENRNGAFFPKSAFQVDLELGQVTCPGGITTTEFRQEPQGGRTFRFGSACLTCPLRDQCTDAAQGRTLHVHAQEALLRAARAAQATPAGQVKLRERVVVEHRLARLGQLRIGQARYVGRQKTRLQLLLACTIANLRWTWNWEQEQAAAKTASGAVNGACQGLTPPHEVLQAARDAVSDWMRSPETVMKRWRRIFAGALRERTPGLRSA